MIMPSRFQQFRGISNLRQIQIHTVYYIYIQMLYIYMLYIYPKNIQTNTNIVGITYIHIPFLSPYERPQPRLAVARWIHLGESAGAAGRPWWRSSPINNQWVIYLGKL